MTRETTTTLADVVPEDLRAAYERHHLVPLWESRTAELFGKQQEEAQVWDWSTMLPIVLQTGDIKAEHVLDRRVLLKTKPHRAHVFDEAITGQLFCSFQMVLPGERARPHRHPMNALRFVVRAGEGARTVVNGSDCPMRRGDMILTPGWCWHEHINEGTEPVIWMDVLDVGLHFALGTTAFQPGPLRDVPTVVPAGTFSASGIVPVLDDPDHHRRAYSPIFRYTWEEATRGLSSAPVATDGSRQIRYANPLHGGPAMDLMDSTLMQLEVGKPTRGYKSSASVICYVAEGQGSSVIGGKTIHWKTNDVFTVPAHLFASHRALDGRARIFQVSNRDVYRRLGLFSEAWED